MPDNEENPVVEAPVVETPAVETPVVETPAPEVKTVPESRFNEVYGEKKRLERLLDAALAGKTNTPPAPAPEPKSEMPDPNDAKYADNAGQYYADVAAHTATQTFQKLKREDEQKASLKTQEERQQAASENFRTKAAAEIAKEPALAQEIELLQTVPFPGPTALLIEGSEQAGLLAKHLARNLQEAHQLAALAKADPMAAAVKIGQLEMRLQGNAQPLKPSVSKAPEPVTPVKGGGSKTGEYIPGVSSVADFIKKFHPAPQ